MRILLLIICSIALPCLAQENVADLVSQAGSESDIQTVTETVEDISQKTFVDEETLEAAVTAPEVEYAEEPSVSVAEENVVPEAREKKAAAGKPAARGSEVVNLSATIVGNQEQPTVLYIVPWKPAEDTTILYLPLSSKAMEHIFGHVERVEHQRQVQYIDQLDKQ